VLSTAGSFSQLPELPSAAGSVTPAACLLVLAVAPASPAAKHGDGQHGRRLATTPDGPAGVEPVGTWPRFDEPTPLFHGGWSD